MKYKCGRSNHTATSDELAMGFYKKSKLPEKSYFKAMVGCVIRGYVNTAMQIFRDKINKENIELAIYEYEDFLTPKEKEFNIEELNDIEKDFY